MAPALPLSDLCFLHHISDSDLPAALFKDLGDFMGSAVFQANVPTSSSLFNHIHFHALEKEMATHSSVLAWRIPGMGEPGGLPSLGSHRVRHD